MELQRSPSILTYKFPNQPEQIIQSPGRISAATKSESRQILLPLQVRYFISARWAAQSAFPGQTTAIGHLDSYNAPNLFLVLNGFTPGGIGHFWIHATYQLNLPPAPEWTGRLDNRGSWDAIWVSGQTTLAQSMQTQTRCNLEIISQNSSQVIEGQWTEPCPSASVAGGKCPEGSIDCGNCCLDCASINSAINGLTGSVLPYSTWRPK